MDILMPILSSIAGGFGSGMNMIGQLLTGEQANSTDKWINSQNIAFQEQANAMTMKREDTAVQRRVADLKAAGINPILAAGQAAESGRVIAPSMGSVRTTDYRNDMLSPILNAMQAYANISMTTEQIKLNKLQQNKIFSETIGQDIDNAINQYDFNRSVKWGASGKAGNIEKGVVSLTEYVDRLIGAFGSAVKQLSSKIFGGSTNSFLKK